MTAEPVLEVRGLTVRYGRSAIALDDLNISVPDRSVVAVLGNNGAGKSTLLRALSGTLRHHKGVAGSKAMSFRGREISRLNAADRVRAGLVQVPEGRQIFTRMTVDENLRAGSTGLADKSKRGTLRDQALELFPVLQGRLRQRAGLLSGGEQQMLAIARGLASDPTLLLLDEPTLGLAPKVIQLIARTIREINSRGTSVLLIEQNAAIALRLSNLAYVLDVGHLRLSGPSAELAKDDRVRRLYLGERPEGEFSGHPAVLNAMVNLE